ncbi:MAG TPA: hypothetical protein VEZ42_07590 [Pseudonocardia sp.]|nr:hypothetical protein [Pseudonocardia sp.]
MVRTLLDWWDGFELWLTQLSFPVQVVLATLVLLPGCWLAAALIDRGVERVVGAVAARRASPGPTTPGPTTAEPAADDDPHP